MFHSYGARTHRYILFGKEITQSTLLAYYDPKEPTVLQTDTSGYGLRTWNLQQGKQVAYASKTLQTYEQGHITLK